MGKKTQKKMMEQFTPSAPPWHTPWKDAFAIQRARVRRPQIEEQLHSLVNKKETVVFS